MLDEIFQEDKSLRKLIFKTGWSEVICEIAPGLKGQIYIYLTYFCCCANRKQPSEWKQRGWSYWIVNIITRERITPCKFCKILACSGKFLIVDCINKLLWMESLENVVGYW